MFFVMMPIVLFVSVLLAVDWRARRRLLREKRQQEHKRRGGSAAARGKRSPARKSTAVS
ncbi:MULTISPECIES: hypothetical protein [Priestia]|uniref:hypothetical protein n=1 Tax=Priestia TaxID=2800373 RepID=UPI000A55706E|nr:MULTISPECIES: hypothetical protein [Priestia]